MGNAKNKMMEDESRGFHCEFEKEICSNCVTEEYIKKFILDKGTLNECNYCHKTATTVSFENFCEFIVTRIFRVFVKAQNELYYDSESSSGYANITPLHTLADLISGFGITDNEDVLDDLSSCVIDSTVCLDPYRVLDDDVSWLWDNFSKIVKTESRFFSYKQPLNNDGRSFVSQFTNTYDFLNLLADLINDMRLFRDIEVGTKIYRARMADQILSWKASDLGTPKPAYSNQANRMNPRGIPIFYGSLDKITTLAEIEKSKNICIAEFENNKKLHFVDFTNIPFISIFDDELADYYFLQDFLRDFVKIISTPQSKNEEQVNLDVEYAPTQIITEFIKNGNDGRIDVDGVLYKSSKNPNGICVAMFIKNEDCIDQGTMGGVVKLLCTEWKEHD